MKRTLCLMMVMASIVVTGCQPSKDMITAEVEFYRLQAEVMKNQGGGPQPLFSIRAQDASKDIVLQNVAEIIVYSPPQPQNGPLVSQYRQVDYSAAWIPAVTGIAGAAMGVAGMGYLAHELVKGTSGSVYYNATGANSNIKTQGNAYSTVSGTTSGGIGNIDGTTPQQVVRPEVVNPVIVETPQPVIVNPEVVNPVVVK